MKRLASIALLFVVAACARNHDVPVVKVEPSQFSRRITAEGNLKAKNATPVAAPMRAAGGLKVAWIAEDGTLLKKDDVIVRFDPTEFEQLLRGGNDDMTTASNKHDKLSVESATTRTNLQRDARQADDELTAAQRFKFDDAEVFSRYQRVESELDEKLAGDRKQHAGKVLGVRETMTRADGELIEIEKRKAGIKLRDAQQGLGSLELRAPHDGILVLQRDWRGDLPRVGSAMWPGMSIGEIPDLRAMKAEVFVLEADAAGIAVGQRATVTLESKPGVVFRGRVSQVDKLARPRLRGVPVQYFGVTIDLDRTDPALMKPGTRVRSVLEVENRANAFSVPRQAVFEKNGRKVVYVKRGGRFVTSDVTIATASAGRVVITKGIAKGDELALRDPSEAANDDRS